MRKSFLSKIVFDVCMYVYIYELSRLSMIELCSRDDFMGNLQIYFI